MPMRPATLALAVLLGACASLGPPLPPAPTAAEIVQMAKDGVASDAIIKRIEASHAIYPLPASELAKLREQGVPDQVIDYMQRTYIDAVRLDEYLRGREAYLAVRLACVRPAVPVSLWLALSLLGLAALNEAARPR